MNEDKFEKLKALLLNRFRAHGEVKEGTLRPLSLSRGSALVFPCLPVSARGPERLQVVSGCRGMGTVKQRAALSSNTLPGRCELPQQTARSPHAVDAN